MIPAEKLDALKAQHGAGKVFTLVRGEVTIALRKPTRAEYRRFVMKLQDKTELYDANEELVRACVLEPSGAALEAILDEWPGLVTDVGGELLMLAGMQAKAEAKKA